MNEFLEEMKERSNDMECREHYIFHKCTFSNPNKLSKKIPIRKIVQQVGDIVITAPWTWHSGWNTGNNIAEASNFMLFDNFCMENAIQKKECECGKHGIELQIKDNNGKEFTLFDGLKQKIFKQFN